MKTALTIAGSDSSGGAGIQADIKTMTMHGVYAMSAITANLALGYDLAESIRRAKEYLTGALSAMLDLGRGSGPLDHMHSIYWGAKRLIQRH